MCCHGAAGVTQLHSCAQNHLMLNQAFSHHPISLYKIRGSHQLFMMSDDDEFFLMMSDELCGNSMIILIPGVQQTQSL